VLLISDLIFSTVLDPRSVINDCGDKHYNTGITPGYLYVMQWEASWLPA